MKFTFDNVDVKEEVLQALKKELVSFGFGTVKVLKADPQSASELPCIGINRVDDSETEQSIADAVDVRFDKETSTHYQVYGTYFSESIEIRVWHTNADERDRLYRHVKAILLALRLSLVEKGLMNISLRTGRDEQDSSMAQAPTVLYWSAITLTYLNPLNITYAEMVPAITAVVPTMHTNTDKQTSTTKSGINGAVVTRYP